MPRQRSICPCMRNESNAACFTDGPIYRLLFPRAAKEYNAVSIDAFPKLAHALGGIPAEIAKSIRDSVPGSNEMIQQFVGARQVLRVEVMEVIAVSPAQPGR